jgi:DNA-binding SARP family transcriptional activator
LFCPITLDRDIDGVLALGEKRDRTPFNLSELVLCAELVKQLDVVGRMRRLRTPHNDCLEAAHLQAQTLQQIGEKVMTSTHTTLSVGKNATTPIEIRVLGPLQITRQGQLIAEAAWGSEKAKGLLAYLLWKSPTGVTREELSEALWPGRSTHETANVFHVTLHRLRRVLQAETDYAPSLNYILHDRRRYRFNTDAPHWLDLTEFQTLLECDDLTSMKGAVNLYRGAYLEDMAWALPVEVEAKRCRLEQLYADTLRCLAAQVNNQEAMLYLEKLLAVEPADEIAHRALVLGYLARGRGDLARRQVGCWQQALAEFGLEPSPETRTIWHRVKN